MMTVPSSRAGILGHAEWTIPAEPDVLVFPTRFAPDTDWRKVNEHWLVVEVLSRSSRVYDRDFKRAAYQALGVQEVWLVDRWDKVVEVWRGSARARRHRDVIRWRVPALRVIVAVDVPALFAGLP